jgi:hypothetical protein
MRMTPLERRLLAVSLLLGILTLSIITGHTLSAAPRAPAVSGNYYGINDAYMVAGTEDWPQKNSNWCAVASIEAVANYTFQVLGGGPSSFPFHAGGQQQIAADMNSAASISQWGTPSWNGVGPGFAADIARDFGTDPRSIAWGIQYESAAGRLARLHQPGPLSPRIAQLGYAYHNVIYHQPANLAVAGIARAIMRFGQPIIVTTAHGLHTVVVSGVWAPNNPDTGYPADVNAVNVWDPAVGSPGGGYQSARLVTWGNYSFNTNSNAWGSVYSPNFWDNNKPPLDPDPAVGPYVPNSQYPSHWIGFRVDFEPDSLVNVSVDYALDENGSVMSHP